MFEVKILKAGDGHILENVAQGVFDHPIKPDQAAAFLNDPLHHLAVALEGDLVVGMASGVKYFHPDKEPSFWINEVGVAPNYRKQGIAKSLIHALLKTGRECGCDGAWVLTDRSNPIAMQLYASTGGVGVDQVMFSYKNPII